MRCRNVVLSLMLLIFLNGRMHAQCDTLRFAEEIKTMEALIWSDYPKAIRNAHSLVNRYKSAPDPCLGRALLELGKTQWANGDYDSSVITLNRGLGVCRQAGDEETSARIYHVIANNYYYQGYYDSAERNFRESLNRFDQLQMARGKLEVLYDMALMYHRRGDFARSLRYLLELESLKEAEPNYVHFVGDFTGINNYFIDTLYYRGVIADERNNYFRFRKENNKVGTYQSLINLATAHREIGDHRKAGYYAARGSQLMEEAGYYPFWYQAAKEYALAGMRDSSFFYHRLALKELPRATKIKVVITYENIANAYMAFHQPDSALLYFLKAFDLNRAMNNRMAIASMHCEMAKVYDELGDAERAEMHLINGLKLARQVSVKHRASLYAFGRDFYSKWQQPARALTYAKLNQQLVDSINRNENALELIRFQAQLETSRKERELEATRLKLRNRTITLVSLAVIATLFVFFIVILFLQRRRIAQQNLQLNERNQEQRAMVQEIHHRVKNNLQYIVSLLSLQAQTASSEELTRNIEDIKNRIMTMGLIHQRLYKVQEISRLDAAPFVNELVTNILNAYPLRVPIRQVITCDPIPLDIDTSISLGLLINELITNAVKHAFAHHDNPELSLALKQMDHGLMLTVRDNGPGFRYPGSGRGFGMKLIQLLVRKLNGTLTQSDPNTLVIRLAGDRPVSKRVHEVEKV